jgi:hypothetical protein
MNNVLAGHLMWVHRFLLRWIDRFPEDRRLERIDGRANCMVWQAGHIASNRRAIAEQLECELRSRPWLELFRPGSAGDPQPEWPSLEAIVDDLQATAERLCERLESIAPEYMAEQVPHVLSDGRAPRAENVVFLLYHEGFHAGQIEQARRILSA